MKTVFSFEVANIRYVPAPHDFIVGKVEIALPSRALNDREVVPNVTAVVRVKNRPDATLSEVQEALISATREALIEAAELLPAGNGAKGQGQT